ncbi:hypothetical protein [Marinobacter sp. SS21]|uniref:hypothetical protein n=1 Tax=Marinobacter sp. SS21 TaxID=2979460 RepID=UPI00232E7DD7|nr:hypothetical protein [Marinobacter sp. SS21]MDC0662091.1 hypothetical protein [Marinobacter sp. SS21]
MTKISVNTIMFWLLAHCGVFLSHPMHVQAKSISKPKRLLKMGAATAQSWFNRVAAGFGYADGYMSINAQRLFTAPDNQARTQASYG